MIMQTWINTNNSAIVHLYHSFFTGNFSIVSIPGSGDERGSIFRQRSFHTIKKEVSKFDTPSKNIQVYLKAIPEP